MENILKKVETLYTDSLKKHGVGSKAVGWTTESGQIVRFDKLVAVIENKDLSYSVNDLGCGYGAMFQYLEENSFKLQQYNGYDISSDMLNCARERIGDNKKVKLFEKSTLQTRADYSFISGIFNVKFESDDEKWEQFIEDTLQNINDNSKKGFAFNLLTSYVDYKEPHLYYADPCKYFNFCKKNFSKNISLIHDYDLWEWTILVKK